MRTYERGFMRTYDNSRISSEFSLASFSGGSASCGDMNAVLEHMPESKICYLLFSCNVR